MPNEQQGTVNDEVNDIDVEVKEDLTEIEKREKEAIDSGEIEFDDEPEDEVEDVVESGTEEEKPSPIVIDGQEYSTEQLRELIKKPEPKIEVSDEVKEDKIAKLKEKFKGDDDLTELLELVGDAKKEVDKVADLKRQLEQQSATENARASLINEREEVQKRLGIDLPELEDPEAKAFFTKELPTMKAWELYALKKGLKPKTKEYNPPNLTDRTEDRGSLSEEHKQMLYNAKKLGAKNPKNVLKGL